MNRFWDKIDKSGDCWLWQGATNGRYGHLSGEQGKTVYAHRVAFELSGEEIPAGLLVLHSCDNTLCVRREHLFLGTHKDNSQDMVTKGRCGLRGKACGPKTKLSEEDVLFIRNSSLSGIELANKLNVSSQHVYNIKNRRSREHV